MASHGILSFIGYAMVAHGTFDGACHGMSRRWSHGMSPIEHSIGQTMHRSRHGRYDGYPMECIIGYLVGCPVGYPMGNHEVCHDFLWGMCHGSSHGRLNGIDSPIGCTIGKSSGCPTSAGHTMAYAMPFHGVPYGTSRGGKLSHGIYRGTPQTTTH